MAISPETTKTSKNIIRITVGVMFFLAGLTFASWASRIAAVQQKLNLSDTALGGILFTLPVGLMVSLPFSGWIITRIGSRKLLLFALPLYAVALACLGLAQTTLQLIAGLFCFGFFSNAMNIAVNTQAVAAEKLYNKPIMASFHGLWSLAGFAGAAIGTLMIGYGVDPSVHFSVILVLVLIGIAVSYRNLQDDAGKVQSGPLFVIPDNSLLKLGAVAFCSMICEGAMFDWSVIYFKKVIHAENAWIAAGYTAFMSTMAGGRFVADWFSGRFGLKRTLQLSGSLTAIGLVVAVVFPVMIPAIIGFMLVGAGVSSVVPLVYSAAGKSGTMSPGVAIAAVSTIGFVGFLVGPPVIGFVAGAFSLRASFMLIAAMGMCVVIVSSKAKL
ncbi:MAG: MFS transporter [Janthinobacterium lividum]